MSSSTGERVSIAHQAIVKNSRISNFTFVGFHANLNNVVLEEGAFVLHGAKLANVTIGKDKLVPIGAVITTQSEADALPSKAEANADEGSPIAIGDNATIEDRVTFHALKGTDI